MKEKILKEKKETYYIAEFGSIAEFNDYICNTPINEAFRWEKLSSVEGTEYFTGTKNYEEATQLMKNGCEDIAKKLTQKINTNKVSLDVSKTVKNFFDVQGFQCCVPLYLQGVPTNMIAKKTIATKQKVVTITKSITYNAGVNTDTIIEESVKALQVVKKIESQGVRCNLNILFASENQEKYQGTSIFCKVRIKNANEKLNVSKLAFCMVHPSMLRRMIFRFIETYPHVTKGFTYGYGKVVSIENQKKGIEKNEYLIPAFLNKDIESIKDLETIC